jgi:hypothetical protein
MVYPNIFKPIELEPFFINGKSINIPKCIVRFDKWTGQPIQNTFGGKPLISVDNKPMFAELAIMTHFINAGWNARWVETYGRHSGPIFLTDWKDDKYKNQINMPILDERILNLLASMAKLNGNSYSGCWDTLAWKDNDFIFAESKRWKRDSIRSTQANWLTAGLQYGLNLDNFLIVQWDM